MVERDFESLRPLRRVIGLAAVFAACSSPVIRPVDYNETHDRPADSEFGTSVKEKLDHQFVLWSKAREAFVKRSSEKGGLIQRSEWEEMLTVPDAERLTPDDLKWLNSDHARRIEASRLGAIQTSSIDLDVIRSTKQVEKFCAEFPFLSMLHVHLAGTLDRKAVDDILTAVNPSIDPAQLTVQISKVGSAEYDAGELDFLSAYNEVTTYKELATKDRKRLVDLFFLSSPAHKFSRFSVIFRLMYQLLTKDPELLYKPVFYEAFFRRCRERGIRYIELREYFDPKKELVARVEAMVKDVEKRFGIKVRVLFALSRSVTDPEVNRRRISDFLALPPSSAIVGVDLLSSEDEAPLFERAQAIYATVIAKRPLFRLGGHVGEHGDPRNPRDALIFGIERLGHGVTLAADPVALEFAARGRIPIEINLKSNLILGAVPSVSQHPFLKLHRLGLRTSLSTDDEGIFETDIRKECELAVSETDIQYDELKEMSSNSIETSFASDIDRAVLREDFREALRRLEAQYATQAR